MTNSADNHPDAGRIFGQSSQGLNNDGKIDQQDYALFVARRNSRRSNLPPWAIRELSLPAAGTAVGATLDGVKPGNQAKDNDGKIDQQDYALFVARSATPAVTTSTGRSRTQPPEASDADHRHWTVARSNQAKTNNDGKVDQQIRVVRGPVRSAVSSRPPVE